MTKSIDKAASRAASKQSSGAGGVNKTIDKSAPQAVATPTRWMVLRTRTGWTHLTEADGLTSLDEDLDDGDVVIYQSSKKRLVMSSGIVEKRKMYTLAEWIKRNGEFDIKSIAIVKPVACSSK